MCLVVFFFKCFKWGIKSNWGMYSKTNDLFRAMGLINIPWRECNLLQTFFNENDNKNRWMIELLVYCFNFEINWEKKIVDWEITKWLKKYINYIEGGC